MVSEVDTMPWEAEYPARVTALMLRYGAETIAYTQKFYEVRNPKGEMILGAGVALWNFARPPELWMLIAKPFFVNIREGLRLTRRALYLPASQYPNLVCDVRKDNVTELHFVRHLGWAPSGQPTLRPNGEAFIQFKVK